MEEFQLLLNDANRTFNTADHLIYVTYPLIKDVRLLIKIVENINIAMLKYMNAIISYDRFYKRIGPLPDNTDARFEVFKTKIANRYSIDRSHIILLIEIKELVEQHKISKMEFVRNDKFIICGDHYKAVKTLDLEKVKQYINNAKPFVMKINKILSNDRLYRR